LTLSEFFAQLFTLEQQVWLSVTDDEKEAKYVIMHIYSLYILVFEHSKYVPTYILADTTEGIEMSMHLHIPSFKYADAVT
jgi:hypothetical protein